MAPRCERYASTGSTGTCALTPAAQAAAGFTRRLDVRVQPERRLPCRHLIPVLPVDAGPFPPRRCPRGSAYRARVSPFRRQRTRTGRVVSARSSPDARGSRRLRRRRLHGARPPSQPSRRPRDIALYVAARLRARTRSLGHLGRPGRLLVAPARTRSGCGAGRPVRGNRQGCPELKSRMRQPARLKRAPQLRSPFEPGNPLAGYYNDLTLEVRAANPVDGAERLRGLISNRHVNFTSVAQLGIGAWQLARDEPSWLSVTTAAARWLADELDDHGRLVFRWAMPHTYEIEPPWISAMTQGEAVSLFLRAAPENDSPEELFSAAARAVMPLLDPSPVVTQTCGRASSSGIPDKSAVPRPQRMDLRPLGALRPLGDGTGRLRSQPTSPDGPPRHSRTGYLHSPRGFRVTTRGAGHATTSSRIRSCTSPALSITVSISNCCARPTNSLRIAASNRWRLDGNGVPPTLLPRRPLFAERRRFE